ncbi:BamA/TamA family outer membrane protein [Sandaracinobacteroides hominis]|uniref:BamA/TamA family outer membrane protein n=1 Tax=Sandaracinobacteroides hominis TaxID=2780086 RepID=UPI0018F5C80E|nr:BamA/TamA family outer membrane protein [Sandaracinobacteroides hominis]
MPIARKTAWLPLFLSCAACVAAPALAQEAAVAPPVIAPDDDLFAPLPAIPELTELPPVDFGDPIAMPPVEPPDADLLAPLPPLAGFDPTPSADFKFADVAQEGIRYSVTVEGLEPTGLGSSFRRLSALKRGEKRPATPAQIASRANSDETLMQRLMFSEGWYSGLVDTDIKVVDDSRAEVRLIATPGDQYRWRQITLDLIPQDKAGLGADFGLKLGDPIIALKVEEAEGALLRKLMESGYAFAEIGARDVVLDNDAPTGTYLLTGDTGPLSVFGPIRMAGFQPFNEGHAQVIARFEPGQPYDARLVDDFRRALIATQSFGGVTVTPVDTGMREPDGRAVTEMRVQGNRGPQRLLTGQLGYSSQDGFRAEGSWRHRSFVQPEGMLTTKAVLGTEEQRLSTQLTMSNWRQRDRTLDFGAELSNLTPPAYIAQTLVFATTLGVASTPIWQKRWTWMGGIGVGASRERSRASILPEDDENDLLPRYTRNFLFVSAPFWVGYDRSNDLLNPTRGYRLRVDLNPEVSREGSSIETYARMFAEGTAYQGIGDSFVLAGRLRLGTIVGADLLNIAPTRRLYAGGGGSVRGYEYQSVGDLGANGRPIGGLSLFESSIEGRYRFGDFGVVGFVDAGSVNPGPMPSLDGTRFGVGVGGRYFTSFGPIRIDVARAINRTSRDPKVALYISIGQSF